MKQAAWVAMVLSVAFAANVHATTIHLGNITGSDSPIPLGHTVGKGAFDDYVKFKLTSLSDISGFFTTFKIPAGITVTLEEKLGPHDWINEGAVSTSGYSFSDLAAGKYRFEVTGIGSKATSFWGGQLNVAAVPEADAWVMMLIGAGLVGFQLRRKHQSLPSSSIAMG